MCSTDCCSNFNTAMGSPVSVIVNLACRGDYSISSCNIHCMMIEPSPLHAKSHEFWKYYINSTHLLPACRYRMKAFCRMVHSGSFS